MMLRRVLTICIAGLMLGLSLGAVVSMQGPTELHAQTEICATHTNCDDQDNTVTSALTVTHHHTPSGDPVDWVSETWKITAIWATDQFAPDACDCQVEKTDTVYASVSTVGGLNVSCSGCSGGAIEDVHVCGEDGCKDSGGTKHPWDYRLIVDVDEHEEVPCPYLGNPDNTEPIHLYSVTYEHYTASNGKVVDTSDCSLGAQKVLRADNYDETDLGPFECPFDCDAEGPLTQLIYEDP